MTYNKDAQKRYNDKCLQYKVQYRLRDHSEGDRLRAYLAQSGQSANSYIKGLIKADLDQRGFMVDDQNG